MPRIFEKDGFRFFFYSNEHSPVHVHVRYAGGEAVFVVGSAVELRESQGLYTDGWASQRLLYMLPAGEGAVRICGSLPNLGAGLNGQRLTVACGGKIAVTREIGFGDFDFELDVISAGDQPLSLEITASKFIVPSALGLGPDPRRLAYLLKSIERVSPKSSV